MEKGQAFAANLIRTIDKLDSLHDLKQAVNFLIKNICSMASWNYGEAWVSDEQKHQMTWLTYWGVSKDFFERFTKLSALCKFGKSVGLIGRVWERKEPLWINDLKSDFNFLRTEIAEAIGFSSAVGIPVLQDEKVVIILTFFISSVKSEDVVFSNILFSHSRMIGEKLHKYGA